MTSLRSVAATLSLVLLAGGAAGLAGCKKDANAGKAALGPATGEGAPPRPELPKIDKGGAAPVQQAGPQRTTGTTFPRAEAKLGPKLSGTITKIWVKENDVVKKGDPLFAVDSRNFALGREQAQAALNAAEVNLRATQVEYDRIKGLVEANAANRAQLDQMQARLDAAKAMVAQAKVGVQQAGQAVADSTVRSPLDGIVAMKLLSEGETATMMPPSVVLVVQDQSVLELKFRLPEKALAEVKAGKKLKATFASVGVTKEAAVIRVGAAVEPHSRTVEIVAEIPNPDGQLKPGMLADVEMLP